MTESIFQESIAVPPCIPKPEAGTAPSVENHFWMSLAQAAASQSPNDAITHALTLLGHQYHADRVWVGRYNTGLTHFWGANEWVRDGIPSHFQEFQGVPVDLMLGAHRKLLKGQNFTIPDVERLPRQSRSLQAELRRENIKSTLCAPLTQGGKLIGFFGFDYVRSLAEWSPAQMQLLDPLGKYLAALLQRTLVPEIRHESKTPSQARIFISERGGQRVLSIDTIAFIKADGDYTKLHLADGRTHLELRSLSNWSAQLPDEQFLRIHQSFLINSTRIERLTRGARWELYIKDVPHPIPVGRAFRHKLRLHMGF